MQNFLIKVGIIGLFLSPFTAYGAIAYDSSAGGSQVGSSPTSVTVTITTVDMTDGIVFAYAVGCGTNWNTWTATATYDGDAMTETGDIFADPTTSYCGVRTFYILSPATGSKIIEVTQGATKAQFLVATAVGYNGVLQSDPIDVQDDIYDQTGLLELVQTTTNTDEWGVVFIQSQADINTLVNVTERIKNGTIYGFIGDTDEAQTGTITQSVIGSDHQTMRQILLNPAESSGGGTATATATSTEALLGSIAFGQAILITLVLLGFVGYIFNHITSKKPWQ